MKKLLLTITGVFAIAVASAQIKTNAGTFTKPVKGDILAEVNFTPNLNNENQFGLNEPAGMNWITGVKLRKFATDNKAYRATVDFALDFETYDSDEKNNDFYLGIAAGMEHHLKGSERLSTYWGYEGVVEFDSYVNKFKSSGDWYKDEKDTMFGLGANALLGADYYIMPNIFLGVEVSYGFMYRTTKEVDYFDYEDYSNTNKSNDFELATGVTSNFRLGWKF